jgi:hypothetical protein
LREYWQNLNRMVVSHLWWWVWRRLHFVLLWIPTIIKFFLLFHGRGLAEDTFLLFFHLYLAPSFELLTMQTCADKTQTTQTGWLKRGIVVFRSIRLFVITYPFPLLFECVCFLERTGFRFPVLYTRAHLPFVFLWCWVLSHVLFCFTHCTQLHPPRSLKNSAVFFCAKFGRVRFIKKQPPCICHAGLWSGIQVVWIFLDSGSRRLVRNDKRC